MVIDSEKSLCKKTEVGEIPNDWHVVRIGECFDFKNGLNKAKEFFGQGTPIVNYLDVLNNPGISEDNVQGKVTVSKEELRAFEVRKGDVLFTRTSETSEEIGMSSAVVGDMKDTVFSGFVLRARPKTDIFELSFKQYCFRSEVVRKQIISSSSKTTRALTSGKLLSQVLIPTPTDLKEQSLIAVALSDTDLLCKKLEELIAKKNDIKRRATQDLLTGRRRLHGFRQKWPVKKLVSLVEMSSGGTPLSTERSYYGGNIPWVTISDMTRVNKYLLDTEKTITEKGLRNSSARLLKPGTLLFAVYASIGKCAIAKIEATCNQAILGLTPTEIDTEFLYYFLTSNEKRFIQMAQTGTQSNLNKEMVENFDIPVPGTEEERAIARTLSDMDAEIEELEKTRGKYLLIKKCMMQQLLTGRIRLA